MAATKWVRDMEAGITAASLLAALARPPVRESLLRLPPDVPKLPVPKEMLQQVSIDTNVEA